MTDLRPEVAEVFRQYGSLYLDKYGSSTSAEQRRVLKDLTICRTAALGGHKLKCDVCGHEEFSYNSCRNRHCVKCQAAARAKWLEEQAANLLEVEYFHVVFTLPENLGPLALQNKRLIYDTLIRVAVETLSTIANDPKHLGAETGFLMVLHTWGQNLHHHPHVHCVVPGGGISPDGANWISSRKKFFLPVRVLSRLFRKKFVSFLRKFRQSEKLSFQGELAFLALPSKWNEFLKSLEATEWVVYSKPPFGGSQRVLKYLARYTHRIAISNQRLISISDGKVTFRWKDYRHGNQQRTMTLEATEFIRRFLQHVLPSGFVHIRHYGFLANRVRKGKLEQVRKLLGENKASAESKPCVPNEVEGARDHDGSTCSVCKRGRLFFVEEIKPQKFQSLETIFARPFNTS